MILRWWKRGIMSKIKKLLGQRIREIRKSKGLTQEYLAEKIGITPANLSVLKTNKGKAIRFSTLNKLCKVLECMPGDILDYQDKGDEENND